MSTPQLHVVNHPLAQHLLAELRDKKTSPERYRSVTNRLTDVLALEATRKLAVREDTVETPVTSTTVQRLDAPVVAVPILRAGLGMLEAVTSLLPDVGVGYIGLERNEETLQPASYYYKTPPLEGTSVLVLDPMLATGGTAAFAVELLRDNGATDITLICVIAAPEGVQHLTNDHPDVKIVTAALDEKLNENGYIVPGLGDFGDRLFDTF